MRRLIFNLVLGFAAFQGAFDSFIVEGHIAHARPDDSKESAPQTSTTKPSEKKPRTEVAVFGGGCFWSMEAVFERVRGVKSVVSGFSGGMVANPDYETVCTGRTGHAEVIRIEFDPDVVSFEKLLNLFWKSHDPTTWNRQGDDFGPQYRSIILYMSESQKRAVLNSYDNLTRRHAFADPIVTELVPFRAFFPAEPYHQNYFRTQPYSDYSLGYIVPKLRKLRLARRGE
jgi:peptide-methionine (S)-S-oxide reductase